MAMAAMAISAVAGLAGSVMQASALNAQAEAQEKIAQFNAHQKNIEANRRQAEGVLQGQLEEREAQSLAGRARAAFAQIGVDTSSGSPLLLEQDIIKEGKFRSGIAVASARNEGRSLKESGKADVYEGKVRAAASRSQARASLLGGIGNAFGTIGKMNFG